jgi:hypothetical protein
VLIVEVVRQHLVHGGGTCGVAVSDGCGGGGGSEARVEQDARWGCSGLKWGADRGGEETLADFEFGLRPRGMGLVQLSRF